MKNKYFSFVALAAAALATSCASDDLAEQKQEQNQNGTQTVTLTASVNDVQTRVGMTKNTGATIASFYWHSGDKILVQTKGSNNTYSGEAFTTTVDTGKESATFTGTVASGSEVGTYAVYPYNEKHSFTSATALTYNLPALYTYDKVETNIFSKTTTTDGNSTTAYPSNPTNMPMLGTITTGDNDSKKISFKCLGGLAVIRIHQMPAEKGTLTVTADQQLSGDFKVENLAETDAQITMATTDTEADKTVTFTYSNATSGGLGIFYLPLAVGTYTNVKVTISGTTVECGSVSISRAGVTAVNIETYSGTVSDYSNKLLRSYGSSSDSKKYYVGSNKYLINEHEFIDLGLSSGTLWATMNVGASKAEEAGSFYRWGETTEFTTNTTTTYSVTNDTFKDVAETWAPSYVQMPTAEQLDELLNTNNCTWTWNSSNKGYDVKSVKNSASIFFYAGGYINNSDHQHHNTDSSEGYYWTKTYISSGDDNDKAYRLYFKGTAELKKWAADRKDGFNIRPVAARPQ